MRVFRLAPLIVAVALLALGSREGVAQTASGVFASTPNFGSTGLANAVFMGGTVAQLEAAASRAGASGVWAQVSNGSFRLLAVGAPAFVNEAFKAEFPTGFSGPAAITLTRATASTSSPAPAPTVVVPSTAVEGCAAGSRPNAASRSVAQVVTSTSTGTAFYIGNGEWLTAEHVVTGVARVQLKSDIISITADVIGTDPARDVAILRSAPQTGLDALAIKQASQALAGIEVWVIGFPLGLSGTPTLTRGTLSRVFVEDGTELLQTDAAVNSGNSGGPLTDGCGQVVGLVVSKIVRNSAAGLGFALSAQTIDAGMSAARARGPVATAVATPTPTPSPAPSAPPGSTEASVIAAVKSISGPTGSGLPSRPVVRLTPGGLVPISISDYLPEANELSHLTLPDATKAGYGRDVLVAVAAAVPGAASGGTYIYFTTWNASYWSSHPSFLIGADFGSCSIIGSRWYCVFPSFDVRLNLKTGSVEYDSLPWSSAGSWRAFSSSPPAAPSAPVPGSTAPPASAPLVIGAVCFVAPGEQGNISLDQCKARSTSIAIGRRWTIFANFRSTAGAVAILTAQSTGKTVTLTVQEIYQEGSGYGLTGLEPGAYGLVVAEADGRRSSSVEIRLTPF